MRAMVIKKSTKKKDYLMEQFPKIFFGRNAIHMYRINFHQLNRRNHFLDFLSKQDGRERKKQVNLKRFETLMHDLLESKEINTIPKKNFKLVLSFSKLI
jgi:hypothetical protein